MASSTTTTTSRQTPAPTRTEALAQGADPFLVQPRPRPQCTHTVMNRLYGNHACDICGRASPLGWLYQCAQDVEHNLPLSAHQHIFMSITPREWDDRAELAALGFSASVRSQYEAGIYTPEQVEKIKDQKRHLHKVLAGEIRDEATSHSFSSPPVPPHRSSSIMQKYGTSPINQVGSGNTFNGTHALDRSTSATAPCHFVCCHHCRPFYHDRVYRSIGVALQAENTPIGPFEANRLRVLDANILSNLKYESAAIQAHGGAASEIAVHDFAASPPYDVSSEYSTISLPTSSSSSSLAQLEHYTHRSASSSPPTSPPASSMTSPHTTLSSISLPITAPLSPADWFARGSNDLPSKDRGSHVRQLDPVATRHAPDLNDDERNALAGALPYLTVNHYDEEDERIRFTSCPAGEDSAEHSSSEGDPIEVAGGVALTEESVETGLPDVVTRTNTPYLPELEPLLCEGEPFYSDVLSSWHEHEDTSMQLRDLQATLTRTTTTTTTGHSRTHTQT